MGALDTDTELVVLKEWAIACDHPEHKVRASHSDDSPVLAVVGIPLWCCGALPRCTFLCLSWITNNPTLRCTGCDRNGILFEDCYRVLGPV